MITSKPNVRYLSIDEHYAQCRLDHCLTCELKGVPKSHIQRIIRSGEVRINKKRCSGSDRLQVGDIVRIPPVVVHQQLQNKPLIPNSFSIIFEDEYLLVIDKPSGVAVHGGSGVAFGAIEQLRAARPDARYLELVHRLDRDTSGLLMIAKKRGALVKLHEQLRENHPKKQYLALSSPRWNEQNRTVCLPLIKYTGANNEKMVRTDESGQRARTDFRVIEHLQATFEGTIFGASLVEADLKTGRTHQIRVHMQSQGCPIAGDERYGDYMRNRLWSKLGLKRMFLHAWKLTINHPISGEKLELTAKLPQELQQFLDKLQKNSSL